MKYKLIISITVVLALVAVVYFTLVRGGTPKYVFRFDKVSNGDITMSVTATGTINAVISVDVGTQVSGIISNLYADFNSIVKEGQIIAQIDSTFLVQSVRDADASLSRAKAQLADSKRALDREKVLVDKGLDQQINYDAALTTYESNEAAMKQAQATLERAKINLAYSTIYAPINGVVIDRKVNVGQTVAASLSSPTLYTIVNDLSKMQVLTTVGEVDIGSVSVGQQATFTVDAYPDETFTGTVSQIRLAPVTVQNVVSYTVVIDVNNDQLKLMPGMTANVKILGASAKNVLRVPNMALRFRPPADVIDTTKMDNRRFSPAGADSNTLAHGGNFGPRGMHRDKQNTLSETDSIGRYATRESVQRPHDSARGTQFGITLRFPEYEKSAYVPLHQAGRARIWVPNAEGKLEPMFVRTGITDGEYTEVTSSSLKSGDQIIVGITYDSGAASEQARSPLTGGGQQRPGGGGLR